MSFAANLFSLFLAISIPPTSIIPVGLVMDNLGNVVAPVTTVTNTNTSDLANGSNGGGGTAGSG